MADKAPYRMTIALKSARPDALGEALAELKRACGEYDQAGEASATLILESYKEAPLRAVYEAFELWLYRYKIGIECKVQLGHAGVRPETIASLRATKTTPMDTAGWEQEELEEEEEAEGRGPIIIGPPLALPPPGVQVVELAGTEVEDGAFSLDEPIGSDAMPSGRR